MCCASAHACCWLHEWMEAWICGCLSSCVVLTGSARRRQKRSWWRPMRFSRRSSSRRSLVRTRCCTHSLAPRSQSLHYARVSCGLWLTGSPGRAQVHAKLELERQRNADLLASCQVAHICAETRPHLRWDWPRICAELAPPPLTRFRQ